MTAELVPAEPGQQLEQIATTGVDLDRIARLGMWLAAVESQSSDPKAKGMGAALRIAYAESLGLPAHAASEIHIINGNLATSAQLKRAQAFAKGYELEPVEETDDSCTVRIIDRKTGRQVGRDVTFTMAEAKRMGLLDKKGKAWHNNPGDMLYARATSKAIRRYIPHVALGVLTAEYVDGEWVSDEVVDADDVPFGDPA